MPQIAYDNRRVADLADVYADASPDLWNGLDNAVRSALTFNDHRADIDEALMAAVGFANDAADSFERGGPYLVRGAADLVPTTQLLDDYRGMIFCTFRKFSDVQKRAAAVLGGNGYSLASASGALAGGGDTYVYPDNLPRVNAHGGPEGRWQDITRYLWPTPYLVMDTGASIAPYNHVTLGQPLFVEPPSPRVHDQPLTIDINNC
jgi:phospholipid/cholesterol/gamma-HCH transport system substrate-binding protein